MSLAEFETWAARVRDKAMLGFVSIVERDAKNWTPQGRATFKCSSPLRHERTPSFYVYADQGRWHDFGTGKGGDAIAYIRERDHSSYREAMSTLALALGMEDYGGGTATQRIDPEDLIREFNADEDARTIFELITEIARICASWIEAPVGLEAHLERAALERGLRPAPQQELRPLHLGGRHGRDDAEADRLARDEPRDDLDLRQADRAHAGVRAASALGDHLQRQRRERAG